MLSWASKTTLQSEAFSFLLILQRQRCLRVQRQSLIVEHALLRPFEHGLLDVRTFAAISVTQHRSRRTNQQHTGLLSVVLHEFFKDDHLSFIQLSG